MAALLRAARALLVSLLLMNGDALASDKATVDKQTISGSGDTVITFSKSAEELLIEYTSPQLSHSNVYVAFGTHLDIGAAVLPYEQNIEGSTVFLPFKADLLLVVSAAQPQPCHGRRWTNWKWNERQELPVRASTEADKLSLHIPRSELGRSDKIDCLVYAKDIAANAGWGTLIGSSDATAVPGAGEKYIPHYWELELGRQGTALATLRSRYGCSDVKPRIYQLFVRLFGNTNETRKQNGTLQENGVGKFDDINDAALNSLQQMGFTHVWLTGVLQQATGTDYSSVGQPADDPDLLKGIAGSPYAIKDYFDVCPDYARDPKNRLAEFKSLLARVHKHKLKALLDFVPNHVARSYNSDVQPESDFGSKGRGGAGDDHSSFFDPQNNFFYLTPGNDGPPMHLPTMHNGQPVSPTCKVEGMKCDGLFDGEKEFGRVTGNNISSWAPKLDDWYETVKLNYGFDFTDHASNRREYPNATAPDKPLPDTWKKMDRVIAYWQGMGVDGFRCDMSHMEPPEFWNWLISEARKRQPDVYFIAEAYDNDPAKVPGSDPTLSMLNHGRGNVMFDLLNAGFNGVYDDPTYRVLKKIYEGPAWANDIDDAWPDDFIFDNSLRYAENHDEVRLAAPKQWAGIGMNVGKPVAAILYGFSRGPIMLYNGQEVGEPAAGVEGFGSDDSRTSIFDYWSMPGLVKWVNGHKYDGGKLSDEQKAQRKFYSELINLTSEPAFRDGHFFALNRANQDNVAYARMPNESASGHWAYSFLRYDPRTQQRFLVVVNLHRDREFTGSRIRLSTEAARFLNLSGAAEKELQARDRLGDGTVIAAQLGDLSTVGLPLPTLKPLTPYFFEITPTP